MKQTRQHIIDRIRAILDKMDLDSDGLVNRRIASGCTNELDALLDNLELVIRYLRFDADSTRQELHAITNNKQTPKN